MSLKTQNNPEPASEGIDPLKVLKAVGYCAVAVVSLGNALEYNLPSLNKPIDVPGLSAKIIPGFVHNSGYDYHLGYSELVVSTPGNYTATLSKGEKILNQSNFNVSNEKQEIVSLGGTPRGGMFGTPNVGFEWASSPGDFQVTIVRTDKGQSETYVAKF